MNNILAFKKIKLDQSFGSFYLFCRLINSTVKDNVEKVATAKTSLDLIKWEIKCWHNASYLKITLIS